MASDDLPNGFTGFPKRDPGFESAAEHIRRSSRDLKRKDERTTSLELERQRARERQAFRNGWQVDDSVNLINKNASVSKDIPTSRVVRHDIDVSNFVQPIDIFSDEPAPEFNKDKLTGIDETDKRWSWVEINLKAIRENILAIRRELHPSTMFMAVVKADGYGHGAVQCAKTALIAGAEYLGVATVDEGVELRNAGITDAPILMLSEPPASAIPLLLANQIMPAISSLEFAIKYGEAAEAIARKAPYHLKINTGMNRIGVRFDHVLDFLGRIAHLRALRLAGTFTHFATADNPDILDFSLQRQRFEDTLSQMRGAGFDPGIIHAANSAATLRFPEVQYDMVRPGLAMYGYFPCAQTYGSVPLMPAMSVYARIAQINEVPVGEGVSYGLVHRSNGFSYTCTVPIGYGDGLRRGLSNRINYIKNGRLVPQVGNICMDQSMFEIDTFNATDDPRDLPHIGDKITIVGSDANAFVTIDEMADVLNTIPYEIMISFGNSRLPRIYT